MAMKWIFARGHGPMRRSALFERQKYSVRGHSRTRFDSPCVLVMTNLHGDGQRIGNSREDATRGRKDKRKEGKRAKSLL
jgi:hypothetical protein